MIRITVPRSRWRRTAIVARSERLGEDGANAPQGASILLGRRFESPRGPDVLALAPSRSDILVRTSSAAMDLIDRSLTLNPSFARGWMLSGWLRTLGGQPRLAIEHFEPPCG